jgi:hypothetical protein
LLLAGEVQDCAHVLEELVSFVFYGFKADLKAGLSEEGKYLEV